MTVTVFTPGKKVKSSDLNMTFDGIFYAILYNRMENDQSGKNHMNKCIVSDIFNNNNGCYNTINTSSTTSIYDSTNQYYTNTEKHCNDIYVSASNFGHWTNACICCLDAGCMGAGLLTKGDRGVSLTGCITKKSNGNIIYVCDYNYLSISTHINGCTYSYGSIVNACGISQIGNYCLSIDTCFNNGSCYDCTQFAEYKKTSPNCYDFYIDGVCQCSISGNQQLSATFSIVECIHYNGNNSASDISFYVCSDLNVGMNKEITTTTQLFNSQKSKVYFITNSNVTNQANITADIYNQDGCLYACDVNQYEVTNLCASDSCCFYAKIKQNIETCPSKITTKGYAIIFE